MSITVTPENAQGIVDEFNAWKKGLPKEQMYLVEAHLDVLKQENDKRKRYPNLGVQSRCVCLAYFYIFYLEHYMEGKPIPKLSSEI